MDNQLLEKLNDLIHLFEHNIKQYKGKHYDEAKARVDFIDKFFKLLGWDVYNKQGYSEQYRDVVREDRIEIKGKVKAPDYCFRIGGSRKFFVEAKKPAVDIKHDIEPAFQLRRYSYTAKLPLSILTDFEEFAVYDTRIKPDKNDQASVARIFYCTYEEYEKQFKFIFDTFSREAILKGSFDQYIEDTKRKKGTSEVDKEFLKLIEKWRESLAKNIALRNKELSIYELNYAVQKIIDRIIFLRIAEDRHVEEYGRIQKLGDSKKPIYPDLVNLFLQADVKFNSGIFDFRADQITPKLKIDDKVLKDIIKSLYYPDSPYEFSVFDVEILGNIYEQFLGKTIRLTPGHQAKVEDKPEVKKAGGVYYTPKYIVDYIVKNTVGEKIKNKTPEQISKLKICDPACGSGSFLLGAYRTLMDYHLDFYIKEKNIKKVLKENKIYQLKENEYRLTIEEKHRILLNNIFGVDIDSQAVEVTKLSLLLKLMEGESQESTGLLFKFSDIKLLPDLSDNIKCGNSLIGSDFYETGQKNLFQDEETVRRINVFDWEKEFPDIFNQGGFDVVIGNPPYVKLHNIDRIALKYYFEKYRTAEKKCDIYAFFTERILMKVLKISGVLGYIISNTWLNLDSFLNMRKIVLVENTLLKICTLKNPFRNVSVSPIIFFVKKRELKNYKYILEHLNIDNFTTINKRELSSSNFNSPAYIVDLSISNESSNILNKLTSKSTTLDKIAILQYGIMTANNDKFVVQISSMHYHKPLLAGKDIKRYFLNWKKDRFVVYLPEEMKKKNTARPGEPERFEQNEKIVFQRYSSSRIIASLDISKFYTLGTTIIAHSKTKYSNKYILGIVNSKLISWWYGRAYTSPTNYIREFEEIPIYKIDFDVKKDEDKHNKIVDLVDSMLSIQKRYHSMKTNHDQRLFEKQINNLDNQIDQLVYKLYGVTKEEIKIIEGQE